MADNKILFKVIVDESGSVTALKATRNGFQDLDLTVNNARKVQEQLNQAIQKMGKGATLKNVKLTEQEYRKLTKTQNQLKDASGATTSAALELGRVIQDAPYGIRGMANNITQLVSQLGFAAKATGGWVNAIKGMISSLTGTLGVVFAVSLVVAALDKFYGANKKAEKSTRDFRESIGSAATDLKSLKLVLDENLLSKEELSKVIDRVNEKYTDLNLKIDEEGKLTKESIKQIDNKILALEDLAKANAMMSVIEEKQKEIIKAQLKLQEETSDRLKSIGAKDLEDFKKNKDELIKVQEGYYKGSIDADKLATKARIQGSIDTFSSEKNKIESEIKELLKLSTDEGFFDDFFNGKKRKGKAPKKQKAEDIDAVWGDIDETVLNVKKRFEDAISGLDVARMMGIISEEQYEEYVSKTKEHFSKDFTVTGVAPKLDFKLSEETQAGIDAYNEKLRKKIRDGFDREELLFYLDIFKTTAQGVGDFISSEYDRQLTIEQNHTNKLNEELNNRLINEKLSVGERKSIQNEIARNDEALRKKQNEIKKKQFNTQKAFNVSMAVVNTYAGATRALAELPAPSNLIVAGTTITTGLLQVASILRQKFQPDSANTPIRTSGSLGGSGGVGNRSFDFNLVGNNQGNQVVDAIQSQFDKPIKAYVVSKDITNAQQLDANTKSSARFGG